MTVGRFDSSSLAKSSQYFVAFSPFSTTFSTFTSVPSPIFPTAEVSSAPLAVMVTELNSPALVPTGVCRNASPRIANPPIMWDTARNFSAANLRSANWVLKNRATRAPKLNALNTIEFIHDFSNFSPGMYENPISNHAPQMKNWRNIIRHSLSITPNGIRACGAAGVDMEGFRGAEAVRTNVKPHPGSGNGKAGREPVRPEVGVSRSPPAWGTIPA